MLKFTSLTPEQAQAIGKQVCQTIQVPVEGWSYGIVSRVVGALLILVLLAYLMKYGFAQNSNSTFSFLILGLVLVITGREVCFGRTRIDHEGFRRTSFFRSKIPWTDMRTARIAGLIAKPRLVLGTKMGPVILRGDSQQLQEAFKAIVQAYAITIQNNPS